MAGRALLLALTVYVGYHAIEGDRGLRSWWRLTRDIEAVRADTARVKAVRAGLEQRVGLLRGKRPDRDMLDERVRLMLNLARPDEIVIFYGGQRAAPAAPGRPER